MKYMNIIALILFPILSTAQKHDYVWTLGDGEETHNIQRPFGGVDLIFSENAVDTLWVQREMSFDHTNASICDSEGNLQFYSNGIYIANSQHKPLINGLGLNDWTDGQRLPQGALALPFPGKEDKYVLFHSKHKLIYRNDTPEFVIDKFLYSIIDMKYQNGFGIVSSKNNTLLNEHSAWGYITACKHANGRDWWITLPSNRDDFINVYLLSLSGIEFSHRSYIPGYKFGYGTGNAIFTQDGTKYLIAQADYIYEHELGIFDFDRCTGKFSLYHQIEEPEGAYIFWLATSPNSQYLYTVLDTSIYQYDLESVNISGSKTLVAEYDGFIDWTYTYFSKPHIAPDGKIYIDPQSSSFYMHVIESPDSPGIACDVRQHSLKLPAYNHRTMPNFPNYRLGPLKGSPCDTIITHTTDWSVDSEIKIYPNPSSGPFTIEIDLPEWDRQDVSAQLFDTHGRLILSHTFPPYAYIYQVEDLQLPTGIYLIKLFRGEEVLKTEKLMID